MQSAYGWHSANSFSMWHCFFWVEHLDDIQGGDKTLNSNKEVVLLSLQLRTIRWHRCAVVSSKNVYLWQHQALFDHLVLVATCQTVPFMDVFQHASPLMLLHIATSTIMYFFLASTSFISLFKTFIITYQSIDLNKDCQHPSLYGLVCSKVTGFGIRWIKLLGYHMALAVDHCIKLLSGYYFKTFGILHFRHTYDTTSAYLCFTLWRHQTLVDHFLVFLSSMILLLW